MYYLIYLALKAHQAFFYFDIYVSYIETLPWDKGSIGRYLSNLSAVKSWLEERSSFKILRNSHLNEINMKQLLVELANQLVSCNQYNLLNIVIETEVRIL